MFNYKRIHLYVKQWLQMLLGFILIRFMSEEEKVEEIIALRSQVALFDLQVIDKKIPKPTVTPAYRQLWGFIFKVLFKMEREFGYC